MLNLCHMRSFSIFSDSTDNGGEGKAAMITAIEVKGQRSVCCCGRQMNEERAEWRSCKVPDTDADAGRVRDYVTLT